MITQSREYGETINPIEPSESQQRVVSVHRNLTETTNIESNNPFISQTVAILISSTMTKYLDHVSCADCILDTDFLANEPTTTNNCNPILGPRFGLLLGNNNEAIFHSRIVSNWELMHLYYIDINPIAIIISAQQSSTIINNLLPCVFPWHMQRNLTNYLLEKPGIS